MSESKKEKSGAGQGCYCNYCADSKYPCVTMEKVLNSDKREDRTETKKAEEG